MQHIISTDFVTVKIYVHIYEEQLHLVGKSVSFQTVFGFRED